MLIGIGGGLAVFATCAVVVSATVSGGNGAGGGDESMLEMLPAAEIEAAVPTLDPSDSKFAIENAKSCKVPLAWVTLMQGPETEGEMVRVRSGAYLSPPFRLTAAPQRIAIPYPAPYPAGRGVLRLVGVARKVEFHLTPGAVHDVNGAFSVNVIWKVRNPCT